MPTITDSITTPDGTCPVTLCTPDGPGPWPGIVMYPDAGGARPVFREMASRLATLGYAVLVPDVYYRSGDWAPFDMAGVFDDTGERNRLFAMMKAITPEVMAADAGAFFDYLAARPEISGHRFGACGYCMGGRTSLMVAGRVPARVAAAMSFHGGGLVSDDSESPHLLAPAITAAVYIGAAQNDASYSQRSSMPRLPKPASSTSSSGIRRCTASPSPTTRPTTRPPPNSTGRRWPISSRRR